MDIRIKDNYLFFRITMFSRLITLRKRKMGTIFFMGQNKPLLTGCFLMKLFSR